MLNAAVSDSEENLPNYDFYAYGSDHEVLLEYLLDAMPCRIFELASRPGRNVMEFRSLGDFEERFNISDWNDDFHTPLILQILPIDAGGKVEFERVAHDADQFGERTFHYRTTGLGLIQLYLSGVVHGELRESHTSHNSETHARNVATRTDDAANWNWDAINSFSRKLNRYIRRLCVRQQPGSLPVLLCANDFMTSVG